jgi:DNA-binding response OmpR family regulator
MTLEVTDRGRILVVDDDVLNADLLKAKLTRHGYDVVAVNSAREALLAVQEYHPQLVLLDVVLPEMTGFEVCRRLTQMTKDTYIPVILVTSMRDLDDKVTGLESGAYDYVTKPFEPDELLARVRSAMRTKRLYDELRATREKLTEAEKIATLGQLAITLHHEINNPLQAIVLSAENMMADLKEGAVSREDIEIVLKSCSRIQAVLKRITGLKRVRSAPYVGHTDMLDIEDSTSEPSNDE